MATVTPEAWKALGFCVVGVSRDGSLLSPDQKACKALLLIEDVWLLFLIFQSYGTLL